MATCCFGLSHHVDRENLPTGSGAAGFAHSSIHRICLLVIGFAERMVCTECAQPLVRLDVVPGILHAACSDQFLKNLYPGSSE